LAFEGYQELGYQDESLSIAFNFRYLKTIQLGKTFPLVITYSHFDYNVMPFGVINALANF